jgi:hypothetical protein
VIPERYLELMEPLSDVRSVLELGNKRGTCGPGDTYKKYFEGLGIRHVSVDINGLDGALPMDLRQPLGLGTFDLVTNIGTSEHVDRQEPVWRNIVAAADMAIACVTPFPGDWPGHGLFYPTAGFYDLLAGLNGFKFAKLDTIGIEGRRLFRVRMVRFAERPFTYPGDQYLAAAPPRAPRH